MQEKIINAIHEGHNVCMTGGGGVGKTYTVNSIREEFKGERKVVVTASTGVAAQNVNGITVHSYAGLGGCTTFEDWAYQMRLSPKLLSKVRGNILSTSILIIDEISMIRSDVLDLLNAVMKWVCKSDRAFGGKQVIVVGDFLQLPPVVKEGEFLSAPWAFQSVAWSEGAFITFQLTKIFRQSDEQFIGALNKVRFGQCDLLTDEIFRSRKNVEFSNHLKIFGTNREVDKYNNQMIDQLETQELVLSGKKYWRNSLDDYKDMMKNIIVNEDITIKINSRLMILANEKDLIYCNGSMGTLLDYIRNDEGDISTLVIRLDNGSVINLPKKKWSIDEKIDEDTIRYIAEVEMMEGPMAAQRIKNEYTRASFLQFPIRVAYGLTCHKCQGLSLDQAEIDCKTLKDYGHVYVALSRIRSINGLKVTNWNPSKIKANKYSLGFYERIAKWS